MAFVAGGGRERAPAAGMAEVGDEKRGHLRVGVGELTGCGNVECSQHLGLGARGHLWWGRKGSGAEAGRVGVRRCQHL